MIYTLTLNPAVDRELAIEAFEFDTVLRASSWRVDYGGKGFNVSRMLRILGLDSVALAFAGGKSGELLDEGLKSLDIATDFVWVPEETRTNVSIVSHQEGRHIKVNEPGPTISEESQVELLKKVSSLARPGDWWVLAGSLPPGVPKDYYGTLVDRLKQAKAKIVLDTSGAALQFGCAAGPDLAKPNAFELSQLTGMPTDDRQGLLAAARVLIAMGVGLAVVSLGKDGALFVEGEKAAIVRSPAIEEKNPIGAGDAMVAGLVYGLVEGFATAEAVCWGIACGAAAASKSGTAMGNRAEVETLLEQSIVRPVE